MKKKKRAKCRAYGTPAFRVYTFWQQSRTPVLKRRDRKGWLKIFGEKRRRKTRENATTKATDCKRKVL